MDDNPSDAELVLHSQGGDTAAFEILIDRYLPMAHQLARRMVARTGMADDVVQESLLQAYLSLRQLKNAERFRSWFYGIVLNVGRNAVRNSHTVALSIEDIAGGTTTERILADVETDPHVFAERQERTAWVLSAVEALPPKDRSAVLMFYFESLSVREVATEIGMTEGAVRVHLHSAREALRERLGSNSTDGQTHPKPRKFKRKRKDMVTVTIADVIETSTPKTWVITLLDASSRRFLPIWVGESEAAAIVRTLRNVSTPRPMTAEFTANLLKASGTSVERVNIAALKTETFYATVTLRTGKATHAVDARPSDALALAVLMNAPITVDDAILAGHGIDASEAHIATLGRGLDVLGAKLASEILATLPDPPADDASEQDWHYAEELFEKQEAVESVVTGFNKGGAIIKVGRLRGFVPTAQLSLIHQRMLGELNDESLLPDQHFQKMIQLIGQNVLIKVIEIDREHNRLILSERAAQNMAQR